jgi:hypothetical protein
MIFFLFGSADLLFLRTLDELRAATDERGKKEPCDYRLESYHLASSLTFSEKGDKSNFLHPPFAAVHAYAS